MEKKSAARELENVADFFLSSGKKEKTPDNNLSEFNGDDSDQAEGEFEVEEAVSVRKRIAYPDAENAQENIRQCLLKHLQEDYHIYRVELRKTTDIERPRSKKSKKEEVLIFLKGSPSH
ncbi:MAG: hypothetical protein PVG99_02070 [Desulfobacteraceae bacterium]